MTVLNGRDYPALGPQFLHDLKVELGLQLEAVVPAPMPENAERDYPQAVEIEVPCKGIGFRTEPGPRVIASWAFRKPDGSLHRMDVAVPEEQRAQLARTELTGDAMVTSVYDATLPEVQAALRKAWGL